MGYSVEEFDKAKTKVLKYILYQKRCEQEVRTKFADKYESNLLDDLIEYLIEAKYIDDKDYIESKMQNFMILKNFSIKEMSYKLLQKGVKKHQLEDYIYSNSEELNEYESKSAYNIIQKRIREQDLSEIKSLLYKKGYKSDNIKNAVERIEQCQD